MPAKVYTDKDADLNLLHGKVCAVIGFGSQGHSHALNLKDSGVNVIVGLHEGSKSIAVAKEHGFAVSSVAEAAQKADIIFFATPDLKIASIYEAEVAPHLRSGKTLLFSHGFAIHFQTVKPPAEVDVIMVAPKGLALAWAKGIGATRAGVLETTFKEETETDLFGEQTVLCGGLTALVQNGFETLIEAGYQPEMAYFECLHELKLIVDLMYESGIAGMRFSISETAKWGDVSVGPMIIDGTVKKKMQRALKEIQSGKFAKGWIGEYEKGLPTYKKLLKDGQKHPIEKVGLRLRSLMPWIHRKNITGAQASY